MDLSSHLALHHVNNFSSLVKMTPSHIFATFTPPSYILLSQLKKLFLHLEEYLTLNRVIQLKENY